MIYEHICKSVADVTTLFVHIVIKKSRKFREPGVISSFSDFAKKKKLKHSSGYFRPFGIKIFPFIIVFYSQFIYITCLV